MINERASKILQTIVERYISDGQPVASKALASDHQVGLSSATIRHIMADLELQGYLQSPHTSAGRVPTRQAYRLFVDNLLMVQHPTITKMDELQAELKPHSDAQVLVQQASQLLSDVTQLVSVVTLPRHQQLVLRQVEFLPLSERRVLVVLVLNDYTVQNRVMQVDRLFNRAELTAAGNYVTEHYSGMNLSEIRQRFANDLQHQRDELEGMLQAVMEFTEDLCHQPSEDCIVRGEHHLLNGMDVTQYPQLRELFEVFAKKQDILSLLDHTMGAEGIQIYIGDESGHKVFDDYSLVTATYTNHDKIVGVLGVIGPTRMAYQRVISAVDVTANLLSRAFEEG